MPQPLFSDLFRSTNKHLCIEVHPQAAAVVYFPLTYWYNSNQDIKPSDLGCLGCAYVALTAVFCR